MHVRVALIYRYRTVSQALTAPKPAQPWGEDGPSHDAGGEGPSPSHLTAAMEGARAEVILVTFPVFFFTLALY